MMVSTTKKLNKFKFGDYFYHIYPIELVIKEITDTVWPRRTLEIYSPGLLTWLWYVLFYAVTSPHSFSFNDLSPDFQ